MATIQTDVKTLMGCRKTVGYQALTDKGKAIYDALCKKLLVTGSIPVLFLDQLTMYAHSYADFLELDERVKTEGHTLISRDKRGDNRLYPNPAVKMRRDALADVMRIAKNFGFSRLDKARLKGSPDVGEDALTNFMNIVNGEDGED